MVFPTVIVEVGFAVGASTSTYLHLGDSARGLLDTGTLAPDEVWTDVSDYVRSVVVTRGSNRVEGPVIRYEAGRTTIVLDNSDRRFDPTNLSGPYVAAGLTQVTPMRAVRIRATWAGTTYNVWRGFVDAWVLSYNDPSYAEVTLTATDAFKVLSNRDRIASAPVGAGESTGARVARILNSAGWNTAERVLATGDTTVQATTLAGDALTELFLVADTEIGELYTDGAGRIVFRNRLAVLTDTRSSTSQGTFGDGPGELSYSQTEPVYDDTTLVNLAQVANEGGTQQTAQDTTSQQQYLVHTHNRTDLLMQTDGAALDYAKFVVFQGKDPELRFATVTIPAHEDEDNLYPQVLAREIGDRITVIRRPPGGGSATQRDVFIRGIQHDIRDTWVTTWSLQSATRYQFMTLDHSTLGQLDSNALAF